MKNTDFFSNGEWRPLLDLRGRTLCTMGHIESYNKAKENFDKYPIAFTKCKDMLESFSSKIKLHIKRGNSIEDNRGKELEESFNRWESMLTKAYKTPSEFFIKMNNMNLDI